MHMTHDAPGDGLTEAEALRRRAIYGPNALAAPRVRSLSETVLSALREPMILLLLAATGIYLALGDKAEGLFMFCGAALSAGLVVVQEARSERALAALRELAQPVAIVRRDGRLRRIPALELTPGDLIEVREGDRAPADAVLVAGDPLMVDESALTGEAAPVVKLVREELTSADLVGAAGDDGSSMLFAATLVVRGQGTARVARVGAATRIGDIGVSLAQIVSGPTLLQKTVRRLVARLGIFAVVVCVAMAAGHVLLRHDVLGGALAGVTVAIALIPEEAPMVLAVFLALGAWRMAKNSVLVRRSAAIDALGAVTALCVDKTGTLTENRMQVVRAWRASQTFDVPGEVTDSGCADLLRIALLACSPQPVDPMDRAIHQIAAKQPATRPLRSYPLTPQRLAVIQVWPHGEGVCLAAKGAPEAIYKLCRLDSQSIEPIHLAVTSFAAAGLRVLGVSSLVREADSPEDPADLTFRFEGLLAFADPVRREAPQAVAEAHAAGVRVVMITGDFGATALAIAQQAGLDCRGGVILGDEIATFDPPTLAARVAGAQVFARVSPDQKLAIIKALKANGEVVAMTGDGVNDAPALEAADVGVAMGLRGTDVAREAADLVLLDDRFSSIIGGMRLGRRIFANLRKALIYIVAIHIPVAGLALIPVLAGLPPVLLPMQIVLLELLIDPICALVFESEPSDRRAMQHPPRAAAEPLFGARQLRRAAIEGGGILILTLGVYLYGLAIFSPEKARAATLVALVAANLSLAITVSSAHGGPVIDRRHALFWAIAAGAVGAVGAAVYAPPLARMFQTAPLPWDVAATTLAVGAIGAAVLGSIGDLDAGVRRRFDRRVGATH